MNVPFFTLVRHYKTIQKEIDGAVRRVVASGTYLLGPETINFEREFSSYIGVAHAVGVGSGTDALTLGICALGLTVTDEVIVPANVYPTAFGVWLACVRTGARLRLVDCQEDAQISLESLKRTITKKTKVIIVVHLYGIPADVIGVKQLLHDIQRDDIMIVEDCAQAAGTLLRSDKIGATDGQAPRKKAGSVGTIGCFSFYPTKNIGAYGDGGMVVTHDKRIAEKIRTLRMYGETKRYESQEPSGVSRLDEIQAAILRVKLRHLDLWVKKRREIVRYYDTNCSTLPFATTLAYPDTSAPHLYVLKAHNRDRIKTYLDNHGIGTAVHYPVPIHLIRAFAYLRYNKGDFPVAERLSRCVLSLPLFPEMTIHEMKYVVEILSIYKSSI